MHITRILSHRQPKLPSSFLPQYTRGRRRDVSTSGSNSSSVEEICLLLAVQQDSLKGMTPPAPKEKGKDRSRGYQASKEAQNVPQRLVLCLIRDHSPSHCCQGKHSEESSINTLVAWTSMGIKQFPLASIRILIMRADGPAGAHAMCGCLSPGYDPSQ